MDKFLETNNVPKLNEEAEGLNRLITISEVKVVIKKLWHRTNDFSGKCYQIFKE